MRINNITSKIFAVFVGVSVMVSCDLNPQPTTAIIYEEGTPLFQSEDDIASFYYGVLASYRSLCSGSFDMTTDVMVDYFNATSGFGNNYGSVHRADNSFTPSDDYVESIWASHYSAIKNYNIAIAEADKVENPELEGTAQYLKGVACYCRASAYLTLTRLFGEVYDEDTASEDLSVPLVTEFSLDYVPVRNTVEDVYYQIYEDLDFAQQILAEDYGQIAAQSPTIDAVYAMWARYYLDTQEYDKAFKMAKKVIESEAGYELASTKDNMLAEYSFDMGTEAVMQMYATQYEGTIAKSIYTLVGNDDSVGKYFGPYFLPSLNLVQAYEPGDYRYQTWFTTTQYPVFINGSYYDGVVEVFVKYIGNENLTVGPFETGAHAAKPIKLAEMYLIAAEAAYQDNDSYNAKNYLNDLQNARNTSETTATFENIKTEWYKEMVGDGHRFVCLKRWGDGIPARPAQPEAQANNMVMVGPAYGDREVKSDSHIFNFPIPAYEIQITPSLKQNEGYSAK